MQLFHNGVRQYFKCHHMYRQYRHALGSLGTVKGGRKELFLPSCSGPSIVAMHLCPTDPLSVFTLSLSFRMTGQSAWLSEEESGWTALCSIIFNSIKTARKLDKMHKPFSKISWITVKPYSLFLVYFSSFCLRFFCIVSPHEGYFMRTGVLYQIPVLHTNLLSMDVNAILRNFPRAYNCIICPQYENNYSVPTVNLYSTFVGWNPEKSALLSHKKSAYFFRISSYTWIIL